MSQAPSVTPLVVACGVTVNQAPQFRVDQMPYGGTNASGNTKEGPHEAVREMTEERTIVIRRST